MNPKTHTPSHLENSGVKKEAHRARKKRRTPQELMAALAVGQKIGRLTAIRQMTGNEANRMECRCDCGNVVVALISSILRGRTGLCGCLPIRKIKVQIKHGAAMGGKRTPEYQIWSSMKSRCDCTNTEKEHYKWYGAKGISVCERWQKFENFYADMGPRPSKDHSIDRIDNDGNYEPGNCRWATRVEQANNRDITRMLEFNGQRMPLIAWAAEIGIHYRTLMSRVNAGWTMDRALGSKARRTYDHARLLENR